MMRRSVNDDDVVRLMRAAQRMARLAQDIGERARHGERALTDAALVAARSPAPGIPDERLVHAARTAVAAYGRVPDFGAPALFRNPAWLLMLDLFLADRTGDSVSVKAASLTLGSAPSTAIRTILDLERMGLVASVSDHKDARRRLLRLTARAEAVLSTYLREIADRHEPTIRVAMKLAHEPERPEAAVQKDQNQSEVVRSKSGSELILQ